MPNNEFGDFQTPLALARAVVAALPPRDYQKVLEPTCGTGSFLRAVQSLKAAQTIGLEVQPNYALQARHYGADVRVKDVFTLNLGSDLTWQDRGEMLVIGNPPWVTNADLTRLGASNIPEKVNFRNLQGIAARTGESNFDVAESVWLKLIRELREYHPTIALLCKTQVARNVISYAADHRFPIGSADFYSVDSMRWFRANVEAGLLMIKVEDGGHEYTCRMFSDLDSRRPYRRFGVVDGKYVSDMDRYVHTRSADGVSPVEWRQGVKHDATRVMELVEDNGPWTKSGMPVSVEGDYLFPLLKSTDLFRGRTGTHSRWALVPQRRLTDDTATLSADAPLLWEYLTANAEILDGRKSSIYRNRPRFCVFGVGDYTFQPYKVAISGMHKNPEFRPVGPIGGRPVVFDDACYFVPFDSGEKASIVAALLRSATVTILIESLVFWDAKRPITKKLLQRLDLCKLLDMVDEGQLISCALDFCQELELDSDRSAIEKQLDQLRRDWGREAFPADDSSQPDSSASSPTA